MREVRSINPSNGQCVFTVSSDSAEMVNKAITRARGSQKNWASLGIEKRSQICITFSELLSKNEDYIARNISEEMGKPLWEAKAEVKASVGKIYHSIKALERTTRVECDKVDYRSITDYKPLGVVAVLGPFNFPLHLPNGHIVPSLLMGNTVVFKPSELTPRIGHIMVGFWRQAGLPEGVINIVQGGKETGEALCEGDVDGVFFTGSNKVGNEINRQLANFNGTGTVLALEMGGNNPLVVWDIDDDDIDNAVSVVLESAFITSGQRCVCARRLIMKDGDMFYKFINKLSERASMLTIGDSLSDPNLGPVVSIHSAHRIIESYNKLVDRGGDIIFPMFQNDYLKTLISPGIVDVTDIVVNDEECFGPLLQVIRVNSFDEAIEEANDTEYGLSAGLISNDLDLWHKFYDNVNAGIINWNKPITGALSENPFGGIGKSGNHRPSAFFAADYCCYPVASLESDKIVKSAFF